MESLIGKLLSAFERRKMNRRELIQSLAAAAAGGHMLASATPVEAAPSATTSSSGFMTTSLDHISYSVQDYGRSRDFYADLMGWELRNDNGENQASLQIGDVGNIIIRNSRQPMSRSRPNRPPLTGVINHISWRIADFDTEAVRDDLESRGLNPRRDQGGGGDYDSYHVLDPDGWDLQIAK